MSTAHSPLNSAGSDRFLQIPYVQIRNNSAILYNHYLNPPPKRVNSGFFFDSNLTMSPIDNFKGKQIYSGTVTDGTRKRMSKAISLMVQSTPVQYMIDPISHTRRKFKMNFITLTVSDCNNIDHNVAYKKLMEPMLKHFRYQYGMRSYVWKVELQQRGQVHYHITTDFYIHHEALRAKWNKLQKKAGYLEDFEKRYGHSNPNSTDVHGVYKMRNIEAYLVKYLQKNGGRDRAADAWISRYSAKAVTRTAEGYYCTSLPSSYFNHVRKCHVKGKVWDCSKNLKIGKYYTTVMDSLNQEKISYYVKQKQATIEFKDHFTFIKFKGIPASAILSPTDLEDYQKHLEAIRNFDIKAYKKPVKVNGRPPDPVQLKPPKPNAVQTRMVFLKSA